MAQTLPDTYLNSTWVIISLHKTNKFGKLSCKFGYLHGWGFAEDACVYSKHLNDSYKYSSDIFQKEKNVKTLDVF